MSEQEWAELGTRLQAEADACFARSGGGGPTPEGARWLLAGSLLYSIAISMQRRPDLLEELAHASRAVLQMERRTLLRMMAEVRKKGSCN